MYLRLCYCSLQTHQIVFLLHAALCTFPQAEGRNLHKTTLAKPFSSSS